MRGNSSGLPDQVASASSGRIVVVSSLGYNMGIKTIQFDDKNWDKDYRQNKTYSKKQAGADYVRLRVAGSAGSGWRNRH